MSNSSAFDVGIRKALGYVAYELSRNYFLEIVFWHYIIRR